MIKCFFYIAFLVILSTMASSLFIKFSGLPFWVGTVFLLSLATILYTLNILLMRHYIEKGAPGLLDIDVDFPPPKNGGEYLWEMTAGSGIVPKWVSWIGMGAIACVGGACLWLIVWLRA